MIQTLIGLARGKFTILSREKPPQLICEFYSSHYLLHRHDHEDVSNTDNQ